MANDGQIVFEVTADGKHAIANIKDITKAIQQETAKWDDAAEKSTDSMADGFSSMLKKVAAGFSAVKIGKALLDIGSAAVSAASDLEEVQNVVDVTFGENAGQIETWAKNAQKQFGLTETQAKRFTSTMGAMLKSSGLAGNEITQVSTDLAGLAADMASFYNLDFDTAFQKIRSGISGETMPLKELGINMSVATLNAFALEQGLEKTFDQMSQGEQTMLRYQYLMSATADAQGDFSRTSDGYANSMRTLETNIESLKEKLGAVLLPAVQEAVGFLNGLLETILPSESQTVLDQIAGIDLDTERKLQEIETTKTQATELKELLDEIFGNGANENGENAGAIVSKFGVNAEETVKYLQSLGLNSEEISKKQQTWLETCKRLVATIPGLNSIINTETGEVKGGVGAITEYVNAWADGQKKMALLKAQAAKRAALDEAYADLPGLEVDKMVAQSRVDKAKKQLQAMYDELGVEADKQWKTINFSDAYNMGLTNDQRIALNMELEYYKTLEGNAKSAEDAYNKLNGEYQEGLRLVEEGDRAIEEMYGDTEDAAAATGEWSEEMQGVGKAAVDSAKEAIAALEDYYNTVRESVAKNVDSNIKGFEKIQTPMQEAKEKTKDLTDQLTKLGSRTEKNADEWDKLNQQINSYEQNTISAQGMAKNLQQQAQYMEEYIANMEKARQLGISDEILAQLTDGSEESYDYLAALAEASPDEVEAINESYQKVIDKKKELTDELTGQQLTVDQTYQSLADKAKEAVAALDLEEEAKTNAGKTIKGLAQEINKHVPDVQDAVDAIISQLERLNGFGIDIDMGGFGNIKFKVSTGQVEGSSRMGLDYVPHDDYIARLHEGEKVLTAQEAAVYRGLSNGSLAGVDLDALGGVMRDNVQAGGNVYLDGRVVGNVISDRQGKAYKSLKRSGWQA